MSAVLLAAGAAVAAPVGVRAVRDALAHRALSCTDTQVVALPPLIAALLGRELAAFVRREQCTLTDSSPIRARLNLFATVSSATR